MERTAQEAVGDRRPGMRRPVLSGARFAARSHDRARRRRRSWLRARARTRAVRARVRQTPAGRVGWRIGVGLVGGLLLVVGVLAIPGPGQGWALVFLALAILSTEFSWAHRARTELWTRLVSARTAYAAASPARRALLTLSLVLLVAVCLCLAWWLSLRVAGVPGWVPGPAADLLSGVPGID